VKEDRLIPAASHAPGREPLRGLIIFDGDDTLWETMPIYSDAKAAFFRQMSEWGFDEQEVRLRFDRVDAENVKRLGFTRQRFPDSMVRTYREFSERCQSAPLPDREACVRDIGMAVFSRPTPLLRGAKRTLERLSRFYSLVLFTKGDLEVQHSRVIASGLGRLFDEVCIAPDKSVEMLGVLANRHRQSPSRTWVVGNSLRSDIKPALDAGMRAIWIPYETWVHEEADDSVARAAIRCESLDQLPELLESSHAPD
jgi:putative hydrolase of the HAD superfamily